MNWKEHAEDLKQGKTVQIRPKGSSMEPKISSGNLVTVEPHNNKLAAGDIVLCKVGGKYFVHLIKTITTQKEKLRYQIGNNKHHINGVVGIENIFGKVTKVEP